MDTMWSLRLAYAEAAKVKVAQEEFCAKAENGLWDSINTPFPEDLKWEALVDVLRGRVKVRKRENYRFTLLIIIRFQPSALKQLIWTLWLGYVAHRSSTLSLRQWQCSYQMNSSSPLPHYIKHQRLG